MSAPPSVPVPAEEVVEAFATAVVETGASTLALDTLLALWAVVDPGWATTTGGRLRLADALRRLDSTEVVRLPSPRGTRWDAALPRLPTTIGIPANRRTRGAVVDPAAELWVPALAWAAQWMRTTRPPQRLRQSLVTVNRWLAARTGTDIEPTCREERSLEVFEDEKVLAQLTGSVLFAPGRLTLGLLRCETPLGGLRVARIADCGPVLVVENKATFDSALRALRARAAAGGSLSYAAVVFGGGDQAAALVPDLCALEALVAVRATSFEYAGDVDIAGISAAEAFLAAAQASGLSARPAVRLWERLASAAPAGDDLTGDARERRDAIAASVRLGLPAAVADRLRDGVRVPQERLSRTVLAETDWWEPEQLQR